MQFGKVLKLLKMKKTATAIENKILKRVMDQYLSIPLCFLQDNKIEDNIILGVKRATNIYFENILNEIELKRYNEINLEVINTIIAEVENLNEQDNYEFLAIMIQLRDYIMDEKDDIIYIIED